MKVELEQANTDTAPVGTNGIVNIPITELVPNPDQPRQTWSDDRDDEGHTALERLAESIRQHGVLQPLVVTPKNGKYLIVCGERRYRAAKNHAKLEALPCVVRPSLAEKDMLELSITENLQREDLTPVDQARAYRVLVDKCGYTVRSLAKKLGLSPAAVSQKLSLLKLTPELQADVRHGKLTETQGTVIAQAVSKHPPEDQPNTLKEIKKRVDAARQEKPKLDTKDVKAIAKATTKATTPNQNKSSKPGKNAPARLKPASSEEKQQAKRFFEIVANIRRDLKPYEKLANTANERRRFAEVLFIVQKNAGKTLQNGVSVLAKLYADLATVEREQHYSK